MPCGGIYPVKPGPGNRKEKKFSTDGGCWVCDRGGCLHFMEEWDTYIHASCALKELSDPESDTYVVVGHGHRVELDFGLEESE